MSFVFVSISVCFQCVCSGILVGSGMQKIAALSNLVSYYCIGLPVGIALMFAAKLRVLGNTLVPLHLFLQPQQFEINTVLCCGIFFMDLMQQYERTF